MQAPKGGRKEPVGSMSHTGTRTNVPRSALQVHVRAAEQKGFILAHASKEPARQGHMQSFYRKPPHWRSLARIKELFIFLSQTGIVSAVWVHKDSSFCFQSQILNSTSYDKECIDSVSVFLRVKGLSQIPEPLKACALFKVKRKYFEKK